jgi:Spy/CpxP family protein refolding chaperone
MSKIVTAAAMTAGFILLTGIPVSAQAPAADDVKLYRKDLRSLKKQIIAANLELTDEEAQKFWPIYDQYTAEMTGIMDQKYSLVNQYLDNYDTLTDAQADAYINGRSAVEESLLQLRLKYIPIFRKALSGRTTALFFQIDWRFGLVTDLQISSQVPTVDQ